MYTHTCIIGIYTHTCRACIVHTYRLVRPAWRALSLTHTHTHKHSRFLSLSLSLIQISIHRGIASPQGMCVYFYARVCGMTHAYLWNDSPSLSPCLSLFFINTTLRYVSARNRCAFISMCASISRCASISYLSHDSCRRVIFSLFRSLSLAHSLAHTSTQCCRASQLVIGVHVHVHMRHTTHVYM